MADVQTLKDAAEKLRILSVRATQASKSGHPTSCASMAEIMSVLFYNEMSLDLSNPRGPSSDRFVLSKGHAAPILYAAWAQAGLFPESDVLNLRKIDSDLEGHPTPRLNFVDVATGSLGQGLSVAAGMAYAGKYIDKASYRVYCLIGDGESAEGSIWEALNFASIYKLDNLVAIFDINRLGQSEPTALQHQLDVYKARLAAFGFEAIVVDGHDVNALLDALAKARQTKGKPTALLCKTFKGYGFPEISDKENWHGKALGDKAEAAIKACEERMVNKNLGVTKPKAPKEQVPDVDLTVKLATPPSYKPGDKIATRRAYGDALVKLGQSNSRVIALDGDTKNSTFSEIYKKAFLDRYIECFIAEQNLTGVAVGLGCRGRTIPFCSTFAAFFTRAFDQLRMGAISQANIKCVGSHCGVSIGEDGPSQMALEDLAMFRAIPDATVLYPSDGVSTEYACELAAQKKGIVFIRTSRPDTAIIYPNEEKFEIGKSKVVKQSANDQALVIGGGVTLHEALKAHALLQQEGINIRVLDIFSVKPIDAQGIAENAKAVNGRVITVEDHYPEGGIGEAVASVLPCNTNHVALAVREIPRSGPPSVLLNKYGIDAASIVKAVKALLSK